MWVYVFTNLMMKNVSLGISICSDEKYESRYL